MNKIAIVILNYNFSTDCLKCIAFFKNQIDVEFEIIIVDNCSCIEDIAELEVLCKNGNYTLLKSSENRGFSAGNNIGLRYAADKGYEYALIVNPDVEIHETDYLSKMIAKMQLDDDIVVLGSDIVNLEGFHQNPLREVSYIEELFCFIELFQRKLLKKLTYVIDYCNNGYCEKLSGCCFMIRVSFLEQIGFLDENTFLYCEEPILAKQVQIAGKKMYYLADSQAIHAHIKSKKGNKYKRLNLFMQSRIYYLKKYSGYSNIALFFLLFSKKLYIHIYNKLIIE